MDEAIQNRAAALADDREYQAAILQEVSRTFALTIPQLPEDLRVVVGNAYLLCRIADTIEDSASLTLHEKKRFSEMFVRVVAGQASAAEFASALAPHLAAGTSEAEKDLIRNAPRVLSVTRRFDAADRSALERCVRIMAGGMEHFQERDFAHGLKDEAHLAAYCYHVAGVVGEMLTELFCMHRASIAARRSELSRLAVSFGQGLQMVNIIKDIWEDKQRGVCWLPQSVFDRYGFDLAQLSPQQHSPAFERGLGDLIASARAHLECALAYTRCIPRPESGIRAFCLLAIGMAVLTLRKINRHRNFTSAAEVKITRRSVYATLVTTKAVGRSDALLHTAFAILACGLPRTATPAT